MLIALAALLAGLYWFVGVRAPRDSSRAPTKAVSSVEAELRELEPAAGSSDGASGTERIRQASPTSENRILVGRVVGDTGPIAGARVRWIAFQLEETEETPSWAGVGWGSLPRRGSETISDAAGRFAFAEMPDGAATFGSVVVASALERAAAGLKLGPDRSKWPADLTLLLQARPGIDVRVVDSDGRGIRDATVHHVGGSETSFAFERYLHDQAQTDADGRTRLPFFDGPQALWAEKDGAASAPWQGADPRNVELRLVPTFEVGGSVEIERGDWGGYEGERRIIVYAFDRGVEVPIARLQGVRDGDWGPVRVPLARGSRFGVRLEGVPLMPETADLGLPTPGERLRVDFRGKKGDCEFYLWPQNDAGETILGANVTAWWGQLFEDSGPNVIHVAARADGILYVGSFPSETVTCRVSAPGYGTVELLREVPCGGGQIVTLRPGGRLVGRCLQDGEPVSDFRVMVWPTGADSEVHAQTFLDRDDGSFALEGLATGEVTLRSLSLDSPNGASAVARIEPGVTADVTLELSSAIRGGGRVVDAESGEPLPGAQVQVIAAAGLLPGVLWGPPIYCLDDGTFEADAFAIGANYLSVVAEGYAEARAKATILESGFYDWGDVPLFRPQQLKIRLAGVEELTEFPVTALRAHALSQTLLPEVHFDSEGVARLDGVPPGDHVLGLSWFGSSWAQLRLRLEAGEDWTFVHRIAGEHELDVRLLEPDREVHTGMANVIVSAVESNGIYTSRFVGIPDEHGWYRFHGVDAEHVQILVEHGGEFLARREADLSAPGTEQIEILLGGEAFRVRVVDGDGNGVAGAFVTIRASTNGEVLTGIATGADGDSELLGVPADNVIADVTHETAGWRFGIPLDGRVRHHELVLASTGALTLVLRDSEEALANVMTRIETPSGIMLTRPRPTDVDGSIRYGALGAGRYRVVCRRADCWTAEVTVDLAEDEVVEVVVPMRRVGGVELAFIGAGGALVTGAAPQLVSREFGVGVEEWIARGLVQAEVPLRTGKDGKLTLEGLPRGWYDWSLDTAGASVTGSFEVLPGRTRQEVVLLP